MDLFNTRLIIEVITIVFSGGVIYQRLKTCERDIADLRKDVRHIIYHLENGKD